MNYFWIFTCLALAEVDFEDKKNEFIIDLVKDIVINDIKEFINLD